MIKKIEVLSELLRKSIHISFFLIIPIASLSIFLALSGLFLAALLYSIAEIYRLHRKYVPVVTSITLMASSSRHGEQDSFILSPLALIVGIFLTLLIFPQPYAYFGITALTIGDGTASLVGKSLGSYWPLYILPQKTLWGILSVFLSTSLLVGLLWSSWPEAFLVGFFATLSETFIPHPWDNFLIPLLVSGAMIALW